jgi:carboxynorspermidine decarboxylase
MLKTKKISTPYYFIDENVLLSNLEKINYLRKNAGIKVLLATKCFSTFAVFPLLKKYLDGTISSSLYETKLGHDKFGKETISYCVGYKEEEIKEINKIADKIIFNSLSQFYSYNNIINPEIDIGLRINPGISYSKYDLADPCRKNSRLGECDYYAIRNLFFNEKFYNNQKVIKYPLKKINGLMFHFNCENEDFDNLKLNIEEIFKKYKDIISQVSWVSLGGGIRYTLDSFPLVRWAIFLKKLMNNLNIQIYLEPGEAVVKNSTKLITTVVDIAYNKKNIAIVDASTEGHMSDVLLYNDIPKVKDTSINYKYTYQIAGRSCLAGDIFGEYNFETPLKVGDTIEINDAGAYSIVKKNWFNGLQMPSIVVKRLSGKIDIVKTFKYKDFLSNNS